MKVDADDIYVAYHEGRLNSSDEFYPAADYEALEARLAALVVVAQRLVDHAKNREQEEWASLPDILELKEAIDSIEVNK